MPVAYLALRLDCTLPPALVGRVERILPFVPDSVHTVTIGQFLLYTWVKQPDLWPANPWHEDPTGAAVVAGYGFARDTNELIDARAVNAAAGLRDVWHLYRGEWSTCRLTADGIAALSSAIGSEHVYHLHSAGFTAVSNRARVLWEVIRAFQLSPSPDVFTLASLLSVGFPVCTTATAVANIRLLDPTQVLRVGSAGVVDVDSLGLAHLEACPTAPDWDRLAEAILGNVRWLHRARAPCVAALTGGKDSRLVLAALSRERLLDTVRFYLSAPPDHADSLVATELSRALPLRFSRTDVPPKGRFLKDIRAHVAFTEGALNAWDLKAGDDYAAQIGIHGLFGELYRGRSAIQSSDPRIASRKLFGTLDVGKILEPEVRRGNI